MNDVARRLVPWVAALALGCGDGTPLQFGPCVPEAVGHVEAFGYYHSPSYLDETMAYSNVVFGWPEDVAPARARGLRAIVDVQSVFEIFSPTAPDDAEIRRRWSEVATALGPNRDAVAALYPVDEPYWNARYGGVPFDEVARRMEAAAALIHATPGFETVPIAVIFAAAEIDWIAGGHARNPAGYDWIGFDQYGAKIARLDRRARTLLSVLRPEQRVVVVPDAALLGSNEDLTRLEERIAFWLGWAEMHEQVVAIVPFIYWSGGDASARWIGARDLPTIRARYAQIGRCIVDASARKRAATTR
jgi:hypothetical protein